MTDQADEADRQPRGSRVGRRLVAALGTMLLITFLVVSVVVFRRLWTSSPTIGQSEPTTQDTHLMVPENSIPSSAGSDSDQIRRFHQVVTNGSLEQLQAALNEGVDVNAPGHSGTTALMLALEAKDLEKSQLLVRFGADPELTDDFNHTALRHSVEFDFAGGVRFLLSLGVDRGYQPKYPLKKVEYDIPLPETPMPAEFKGFMSEEQWREMSDNSDRQLREMWQNPTVAPIITEVQSIEVLKLFLEAGDDLNLAPAEVRRLLIGLETGGELRVAESDYRQHKSPRYGNSNPERMDFAFWQDMIRTGVNAYAARTKFEDDEPFTNPGVVWCFDRFGSSLTQLVDGRFVQIGGEHEDFYDPDFYIYNDLVVHDGRGNCEIHGYPRDIFPPTDFHTATLCPDGIYIVGCLGYVDQRKAGVTPVYHVTLDSWEIKAIATDGEMPGWIHNHRARYLPDRNAIRINGGETHAATEEGEELLMPVEQEFELELARHRWKRIR